MKIVFFIHGEFIKNVRNRNYCPDDIFLSAEGLSIMRKNRIVLLSVLTFIIAGLLSSCGTQAAPQPTVDMDQIKTSAAETIAAGFTETAMSMPTNTPVPPTYTPIAATATLGMPTVNAGNAAGAAILPGTTSANSTPGTTAGAVPTTGISSITTNNVAAAPTATIGTAGDKALWADQKPSDNTIFTPGQEFDITWYLTNTGTTTWSTDYSLRFYSGTNFAKGGGSRWHVPATTAPNATVGISIDAIAPSTAGTYKMAWVLANEGDTNFYTVDITIIVQ